MFSNDRHSDYRLLEKPEIMAAISSASEINLSKSFFHSMSASTLSQGKPLLRKPTLTQSQETF